MHFPRPSRDEHVFQHLLSMCSSYLTNASSCFQAFVFLELDTDDRDSLCIRGTGPLLSHVLQMVPLVWGHWSGCNLVLRNFRLPLDTSSLFSSVLPAPPGNQTRTQPSGFKFICSFVPTSSRHRNAFSSRGDEGILSQILNLLSQHHLLHDPQFTPSI